MNFGQNLYFCVFGVHPNGAALYLDYFGNVNKQEPLHCYEKCRGSFNH